MEKVRQDTVDSLTKMRSYQLKWMIEEANLDGSMCIEKSELVSMLVPYVMLLPCHPAWA